MINYLWLNRSSSGKDPPITDIRKRDLETGVAFLMQRILRCGVVAHRAIASVEKSTGERFQAPLRSRLTLKQEGGRATTEVLSPQRLVQDGGFSKEPYSGAS